MLCQKNIDFNVLNDNNETFLFKKLEKGDMYISQFDKIIKDHLNYITTLLNNVDNIDVNLENKNGQAFFEELISKRRLENYVNTSNLIQSLEKQNYNFNRLDHENRTFLPRMLICTPDMTFNLSKTMLLKSFDITTESRWLYHMLTHQLDNIHNYIYYMFKRNDYVKLFFKLYKKLFLLEKHILLIIRS